MATPSTRGARHALLAGLVALAALACTSPVPTASPTLNPSPSPLDAPASDTLRIALAAEPTGFLVPTPDEPTELVDGFLHAGLYRLDGQLVPQPDLAAGGPVVRGKGLAWTIALASGRRFSDGTPVTATDVMRTYQLALSPACPFGDTCRLAATALAKVAAPDAGHVVLTLRRPWAPLQAELLARLPVLPAAALDASLTRFLAGAVGTDAAALNELLGRIDEGLNAEACLDATSGPGCDAATYVPFLETALARAQVPLPDRQRYQGADGQPDPTGYGAALLERVKALGRALAAKGTDRLAAALPLLDLQAAPIGAGPFRLARDDPGASLELERWGPSPGRGAPDRVRLLIMPDPVAAAAALQAGDLDWLPDVEADLVPGLAATSGLRVATRPSDTLRLLVFNVRPGHPYADPVARRAFATCLDRTSALAEATRGLGIAAASPLPPASWAAAGDLPWPAPDPGSARAALEAAGWHLGSDGVFAHDGLRLASAVYVRPGRSDQLAFVTAAASQLRACGIELQVQATSLSGQALLVQLEFPNLFETFLGTQAVGRDPDEDLGRLESSRVTRAADPGDANFGGWSDRATDGYLARARIVTDRADRARLYGQLQVRLAEQVPVLPLAWEPAYAAAATRVRDGRGDMLDLGRAGYERDVLEWRLATP